MSIREVPTVAWRFARQRWRGVALTVLGIVLIAWLAWVPTFQACIRQAKEDSRGKQTPALHVAGSYSLCIARVLDRHNGLLVAVFTLTLWLTTQATLSHLRQQFIAEHRPRLRIRQIAFVTDDDSPAIDFTIINVGESTATLVESSVKIWVIGKGEDWPPIPPYDPPTTEPRTRKLANGETVQWRETDPPNHHHLLIGDVASDTLNTVLLGYLVYADDNGTKRRVGFARLRVKSTNRFLPVEDHPDYEYED